jgi:thiol-disulfide isomerase/thioredoxin
MTRRALDPRWGVAAVALLGLATIFWPRASSEAATAPESEGGFLLDAGGRPTPIAREMKPVTLVHFWATWCAPCVEEMPKLLAFASGVGDDRFGLLLVAVADQPEAAKKFVGSERFPLLFDPSWEVAHRFSTEKLPETHLVVSGEVVESFIGASDWSARDVQGRVLRWLQGRN